MFSASFARALKTVIPAACPPKPWRKWKAGILCDEKFFFIVFFMHKPYPTSVLLLLSVFTYYCTGYIVAIFSILATMLFYSKTGFFAYMMPVFPCIAGFLIGRMMGGHRKSREGLLLSLVIPAALAFLEMKVFHGAFLKVIMHPVPHYTLAFHHYALFFFCALLLACSFWGYRMGLKRY